MIENILNIAQKAGKKILEIYKSDDFDIEIKQDNSPVTRADLSANEIIEQELSKISDHPILSEEKVIHIFHVERRTTQTY